MVDVGDAVYVPLNRFDTSGVYHDWSNGHVIFKCCSTGGLPNAIVNLNPSPNQSSNHFQMTSLNEIQNIMGVLQGFSFMWAFNILHETSEVSCKSLKL